MRKYASQQKRGVFAGTKEEKSKIIKLQNKLNKKGVKVDKYKLSEFKYLNTEAAVKNLISHLEKEVKKVTFAGSSSQKGQITKLSKQIGIQVNLDELTTETLVNREINKLQRILKNQFKGRRRTNKTLVLRDGKKLTAEQVNNIQDKIIEFNTFQKESLKKTKEEEYITYLDRLEAGQKDAALIGKLSYSRESLKKMSSRAIKNLLDFKINPILSNNDTNYYLNNLKEKHKQFFNDVILSPINQNTEYNAEFYYDTEGNRYAAYKEGRMDISELADWIRENIPNSVIANTITETQNNIESKIMPSDQWLSSERGQEIHEERVLRFFKSILENDRLAKELAYS